MFKILFKFRDCQIFIKGFYRKATKTDKLKISKYYNLLNILLKPIKMCLFKLVLLIIVMCIK